MLENFNRCSSNGNTFILAKKTGHTAIITPQSIVSIQME